jgi:hypothetical protein
MKKVLMFSLAASAVLTSCVKDDGPAGCPAQIRFTGDLTPIHNTRVGGINGEVWTQGDHLGIYMIRASPGTLDETRPDNVIRGNVPYDASASATSVSLNPVGTPLSYPVDDSEVRFIAYHPYDRTRITNDYRLEILLTDQSNPSAIDVLYSSVTGPYKRSSASEVPLLFEHALVKLVFTFSYAAGITPPANNAMTVAVSDQYPRASLNLKTGSAIGFGASTTITTSGTTARVEAIVAPNPTTEGIVFTVTNASGNRYSCAAPLLTTGWTGGYRYTYNIVLRDDTARIAGTIGPWIDEPNSDDGDITSIDGGRIPTTR